MTFEERLDAYLRERGIANFRARELCPAGKRTNAPGGSTVILQRVPDELWPHIVPTARALEWLRAKLGTPIYLTSAYRDPAYNAAVGGERDSLHLTFCAVDLNAGGRYTPKEIAAALEAHPDARHFGIGIYPAQGFVHLDTRGLLGRPAPARW